jgi:cyclopropane fatty-acyl-phospholipid synthase-like methyltransferase
MILGGWIAQALSISASLGIADLVADKPKTLEELAAATSTHAVSLRRLLRALISVGVYARDADGRYRNSPLSEPLRRDVPGSMTAAAKMMGEEHHQAWGNLLQSVKTGEPAFDHLFGENWFEYVAKNPEASKTFNDAMTNFATQSHSAIVDAYDFSGIETICDVGGGHGALLSRIVTANPHMKGILFDLPHVVAGAPALLEERGTTERIEVRSGDFFSEVPNADAHIMSHIVHDWDDERAIKILQACRRAVKDGGKVLLVEMVVPEGDEPSPSKWMDLNMLAMTPGGRERTEAEYSALLQKAGYKLSRIVPSQAPVSVVEGLAV